MQKTKPKKKKPHFFVELAQVQTPLREHCCECHESPPNSLNTILSRFQLNKMMSCQQTYYVALIMFNTYINSTLR